MPETKARRATRQQPTGHLRAFFRPSRGQLVAGVALFLTALIVVLTLRSQANQPEFANVRQAAVAVAPARPAVHQDAPHAASGTSPESAIAAASRTSTASVWALKSAAGIAARFLGDQA